MIKSTIDGYIVDKENELLQLDDDLANMIITQEYYDTQYPIVESQKIDLESISSTLSEEIGGKQAGNFTTMEDLLINKDQTMDEMNRSITKIVPSECVDQDYVGTIYSTLTTGLNNLISIDNIDIFDPSFKDNSSEISSYLSQLTVIKSTVGEIKNKVVQYIDNIRDLSNNIGYSQLQGDTCSNVLFSKLTTFKSVNQLTDINDIRNSIDVASTIKDKIDNFKIS